MFLITGECWAGNDTYQFHGASDSEDCVDRFWNKTCTADGVIYNYEENPCAGMGNANFVYGVLKLIP